MMKTMIHLAVGIQQEAMQVLIESAALTIVGQV
jgi:hypothetical protein